MTKISLEAAKKLAKDQKTPAKKLVSLAEIFFEGELDALLSKNPNTPKDLIFEIGRRAPALFLKNVSLSEHLKSDPLWLAPADGYFAAQLLSSKDFPEWLWPYLVDHPEAETRSAVAAHEKTLGDSLSRLAADKKKEVRLAVAKRHTIPSEIVTALAQDTAAEIRALIAEKSQDASVLEILLKDKDRNVKASLCWNPALSQEMLGLLSKEFPAAVASNPKAPAELLRGLYQEGEYSVLQALATNPQTPADVLKRLADNKDQKVREQLALNREAPVEVLRALLEDPSKKVKGYAKETLALIKKKK